MMFVLTEDEVEFLESCECCRIATSFKDKPHVVPVCYIYANNFFYIATDYQTKKYWNILHNPHVCILIDIYRPKHHKGLIIFGKAKIIENGDLYKWIYSRFFEKFVWVKEDPWSEGEAPFLEINPYQKAKWGIK